MVGASGKSTTSVVEDYLQVLHYLTRDGSPVIAARLAERLNVTPPTVTATLQRMELVKDHEVRRQAMRRGSICGHDAQI